MKMNYGLVLSGFYLGEGGTINNAHMLHKSILSMYKMLQKMYRFFQISTYMSNQTHAAYYAILLIMQYYQNLTQL